MDQYDRGIYLRNYEMDPQTNGYITIPRYSSGINEPYERETRYQHPYRNKYKPGFEDSHGDVRLIRPRTSEEIQWEKHLGTSNDRIANIPIDGDHAMINNEARYSILHRDNERENFNGDSSSKAWYKNETYVMFFIILLVVCYLAVLVKNNTDELKMYKLMMLYRGGNNVSHS